MNHSLHLNGEWEYYQAGIQALDQRIHQIKINEKKLKKRNIEKLSLGILTFLSLHL